MRDYHLSPVQIAFLEARVLYARTIGKRPARDSKRSAEAERSAVAEVPLLLDRLLLPAAGQPRPGHGGFSPLAELRQILLQGPRRHRPDLSRQRPAQRRGRGIPAWRPTAIPTMPTRGGSSPRRSCAGTSAAAPRNRTGAGSRPCSRRSRNSVPTTARSSCSGAEMLLDRGQQESRGPRTGQRFCAGQEPHRGAPRGFAQSRRVLDRPGQSGGPAGKNGCRPSRFSTKPAASWATTCPSASRGPCSCCRDLGLQAGAEIENLAGDADAFCTAIKSASGTGF